jgi:hypothetical protein
LFWGHDLQKKKAFNVPLVCAENSAEMAVNSLRQRRTSEIRSEKKNKNKSNEKIN